MTRRARTRARMLNTDALGAFLGLTGILLSLAGILLALFRWLEGQ